MSQNIKIKLCVKVAYVLVDKEQQYNDNLRSFVIRHYCFNIRLTNPTIYEKHWSKTLSDEQHIKNELFMRFLRLTNFYCLLIFLNNPLIVMERGINKFTFLGRLFCA